MAHLALWIYVWRRNKRLQITTLEVRGWGRGDGRILSWVENHLGSPVHHPAITHRVEASAQKMRGGAGGHEAPDTSSYKNAANNSKSGQIYSARAKWTHIPLLLNDLFVPNYTITGVLMATHVPGWDLLFFQHIKTIQTTIYQTKHTQKIDKEQAHVSLHIDLVVLMFS